MKLFRASGDEDDDEDKKHFRRDRNKYHLEDSEKKTIERSNFQFYIKNLILKRFIPNI